MEFAAAFLLSLVGGYLFAVTFSYTSYGMRRLDGQHVYLRAAFFAVILFTIALCIRYWIRSACDVCAAGEDSLMAYFAPAMKDPKNLRQLEFVMTAIYSLVLGPILGSVGTLVVPTRWALRFNLSDMDWLLYTSQRDELPVSVTLTNRKVYIGMVQRITDPQRPPVSITLLPMFSGHRREDGRLKLTTNYQKIYLAVAGEIERFKLPAEWEPTFVIVIRAEEIVSVNMFSPLVYSEFNPGWEDAIGQPEPKEKTELLVEFTNAHTVEIRPSPESGHGNPGKPKPPADHSAATSIDPKV